jgi:hypothetical protein
MPRRPEQAIQRAVFQHIEARAMPGVFAFHVPNGGWRSRVEGAILKGMGVRAGVPDVIAIKDGKVYALELKADGGRATEKQQQTMATLTLVGATTGVAVGLDDALQLLEAWGLLRKSV